MLRFDRPSALHDALGPAVRSWERMTRGGAQGVAPHLVEPGRLVVLYDLDCGVCQETARALRRWDRGHRLEFVPLQRAATSGRPDLERVAREHSLEADLHVLDTLTGSLAIGGHAALAILDALPGGWLFRPWAGLPSTTAAADVLYRLATRHRDTVGWMVGLRDEVACPADLVASNGSGDGRSAFAR